MVETRFYLNEIRKASAFLQTKAQTEEEILKSLKYIDKALKRIVTKQKTKKCM